jgi:hypothetical protein
MARWVGIEDSALVRWIEQVDRWAVSEWARRVYRGTARAADAGGTS